MRWKEQGRRVQRSASSALDCGICTGDCRCCQTACICEPGQCHCYDCSPKACCAKAAGAERPECDCKGTCTCNK
ncbi:hypothetical protein WR25_08084 [Diploscapter pachys]|uniref:Metallothionein n=1 Tax=Diploscapter pachys TaxID=2018661 RepID=A0A2A2L1F4_9BILA|nr:hypothetical protein WR25_08084 [Diploscapter pachys]